MSRWYRAYEGTVTDAKLGEVALVAECSRSVAIATWHAILESCATVNDGGRIDTTPRRVAVILGEPPAVIERVFAELTTLGMIVGNVVAAWARRQFQSDSSTERSRKHRATKRNVDATLQGRSATPPDTETETEGKEEEEDAGAAGERDQLPASDPTPVKRMIPTEWQPSDEDRAFVAMNTGVPAWTPDRLEHERGSFIDYYRARSVEIGDISAQWRSWVRQAVRLRPGPGIPELRLATDGGRASSRRPGRGMADPAPAERFRQTDEELAAQDARVASWGALA